MKMLKTNPQQKIFFESVRNAMSEGFNKDDFIGIVLILGLTLGTSLVFMGLFRNRYQIRRGLVFWTRVLLGRAQWSGRRWKADYPVSVIVPLSSRPLEKHYTVNLSRGGMFVKTSLPYEVNTHFEFVLQLDDEVRIPGVALVRWVKREHEVESPPGIGCEFIKMSEDALKKIKIYLRRKKTRTYRR